MTQNAVEIAHFGRQKRGGGYEIKDFRGAIKGKAPGFLLPSLPGGGLPLLPAAPQQSQAAGVSWLCGMLCGNTCGIFADVLRKCAKRGDFCKIAALSCRNRAGSRGRARPGDGGVQLFPKWK